MKLRHNWAVQELVEIWSENRQKIFDFATRTGRGAADDDVDERPKKRRKVDGGGGGGAVVVQKSGLEERRSTRSQSRRVASHASQDAQALPSTQEEVPDSDAGSAYTESPDVSRHFQAPEPNDGLVGCPNCNRRMKETLINSHLDKCLSGLIDSPTPPPPPPSAASAISPSSHGLQAGTIAYTTTKPAGSTAIQRLPTINYSLLNEANMRRKLKELGIPNAGSKDVMRRRHTEWMNLWNANCDSLQPVSKRKLLEELDRWERNLGRDERQRLQQGGGGGAGGGSGGGGGGMMDKEFDREGYMRKERSEFEELIRRARESRKERPKPEAAEGGEGSDEMPAAGGLNAVQDVAMLPPVQDQHPHAADAAQHAGDLTMTNGIHDTEEKQVDQPSAMQTLVPSTPPRQAQATNQPIDLITPEKPSEQRLTNGQDSNAQEMLY